MSTLDRESLDRLRAEWRGLQEEHRRMRTRFATVSAAQNRAEALVAVNDLHHSVSEHFSREERSGGVFAIIGPKTEEAASLLREHGHLRRKVIEARAMMESYEETTIEALQAACDALCDAMREHEDREAALIESYLSED
ncbi:MAG: hemerythrin domain-containing protein [Deltaproteobacteria bacterium]|nr:hemerythrin domain-containing protein [Deltaproteobacteria bacterium]